MTPVLGWTLATPAWLLLRLALPLVVADLVPLHAPRPAVSIEALAAAGPASPVSGS